MKCSRSALEEVSMGLELPSADAGRGGCLMSAPVIPLG